MNAQLWNRILSARLSDEEGTEVAARKNPGATLDELDQAETWLRVVLPSCFKDFYRLTDGCDLFGVDVLPHSRWETWPDLPLVAFHPWGNGDFDAVDCRSGGVVFLNHGPEASCFVAASFNEWIREVFAELRLRGTLYHPMDYLHHPGEGGVYAHCIDALREQGIEPKW